MNGSLPVEWKLSLTFAQLREANAMRCKESYHRNIKEWSPADWMMAVVGEVGELAHDLKRLRKGAVTYKSCIANEMADIVIYLDLLAEATGIDLGAAITRKFNQTSESINSSCKLTANECRWTDGRDTLWPHDALPQPQQGDKTPSSTAENDEPGPHPKPFTGGIL